MLRTKPDTGTAISPDAYAYMAETPLSVKRQLLDTVALYGNEDTNMLEQAIEAVASGRAVYWTAASYSNATASDLPYELNRGRSIKETVEAAYSDSRFPFNPALKNKLRAAALDTIVPCNRAAVNALAKAYIEIAGSFRDDAELELRRVRDTRRAA